MEKEWKFWILVYDRRLDEGKSYEKVIRNYFKDIKCILFIIMIIIFFELKKILFYLV